MRSHLRLSVFATAATLSVATGRLAAQQSNPATDGPTRVVATYEFGNAGSSVTFPRRVTVSDSAGILVARAALTGQRDEIPMQVTVLASDLVLQGETLDGLLTMVFDRQAEGGATKVTRGRWTLGTVEGKLRGR